MSLIINIKKEFNNSPILVSCAVIGLVMAIVTFSIGFGISPTTIEINDNQNSEILFNVNNLLICIAYYIFASLFGTSLIRLLSKYHDITATFLSIPVAVIINFSTYIAINILPPVVLNKSQLLGVSNLIYWSTLIIFVAFLGKAVGSNLLYTSTSSKKSSLSEENEKPESDEASNIIGTIAFLLILLWAWGGMVSYGQNSLITSFLPESWQPTPEETVQTR